MPCAHEVTATGQGEPSPVNPLKALKAGKEH